MVCCVCQKKLPNRWAIGKREVVDGTERFYCQLHANTEFTRGKRPHENTKKEVPMGNDKMTDRTDSEQAIARKASAGLARKAWNECSSLAGRLGGGVKVLWAKIHPDRSPEAMLSMLNESLSGNKKRLAELKPDLDGAYREIVAKKKDYQNAPPMRQRILKVELQTLMAKYKSLEREFLILSENERSIESVKGRFLEVLAYGLRGTLDADMVDRLADNIDDKADEAEGVQDALGDLERAGKRTDRDGGDFDAELAGFDGDAGLFDDEAINQPTDKEKNNENNETGLADGSVDHVAELAGSVA